MQPTHSIADRETDASPWSPSDLLNGQWLRLGDVAAAITVGAVTWPERPGIRSKYQEAGHD